jgi:hypothetical protein
MPLEGLKRGLEGLVFLRVHRANGKRACKGLKVGKEKPPEGGLVSG